MASPINMHLHTGRHGEILAQQHLQQQGYSLLHTNYRYKRAEIDIIAQKGEVLVFAEVKTRTTDAFGYPEAAVNAQKENMLLNAAEAYILANNWEKEIRFDIISVTLTTPPTIVHFEDAFY